MNFVDSLELFHVSAKEIPCLTGRGAPTGRTEGVHGVLYMDIDTGDLYKCRGSVDGGFRWDMQGGSGTTPVKGVDYFTEADKLEIVALVIEALQGKVIPGYVDESGNIIIANLPDGSYTASYVNKDGSTISIGSLEVDESGGSEPAYTNQIPISTDANGDLFVGTNGEAGYKTGYRLSLSTGTEKEAEAYMVTGFIPAVNGDTIRVKNIHFSEADTYDNITCYDSNKQPLNGGLTNYGTTLYNLFVTLGSENNGVYTGTLDGTAHHGMGATSGLAYIRICSSSITDESVLTINQEIV